MNNQIQNNQPTAEKRGGKFCSRCGQPLDATGICHNPGCPTYLNANQFAAQQRQVNPQYSAVPQQQPYAQQYQQPYNQQYQQQSYIQNSVPQQPSAPTIFTLAWDYVKVFFSSKPLAAVENIGKTAENIWLVLGSAATILISLGLFGIGSQKVYQEANAAANISYIYHLLAKDGLSDDISFVSKENTMLFDNFKLFVFLFLTVVLMFFAVAGINMIMFAVHKQKINYLGSLNILSASLLPLMLGSAIAFVTSYISIILACIIFCVALILSFVQLYYGMQKACGFVKSPFWSFSAVIAAYMASLIVIMTVLGKMLS